MRLRVPTVPRVPELRVRQALQRPEPVRALQPSGPEPVRAPEQPLAWGRGSVRRTDVRREPSELRTGPEPSRLLLRVLHAACVQRGVQCLMTAP